MGDPDQRQRGKAYESGQPAHRKFNAEPSSRPLFTGLLVQVKPQEGLFALVDPHRFSGRTAPQGQQNMASRGNPNSRFLLMSRKINFEKKYFHTLIFLCLKFTFVLFVIFVTNEVQQQRLGERFTTQAVAHDQRTSSRMETIC